MSIDIQKYYPGSVDIDNYDIRQALMDNLAPIQSDDQIRDNRYLDSEYVNTRLIPALTQLTDQKKIAELKAAVETNSDLKDLVEKFTYTPFQQDIVPVAKSDIEIVRSSLGGVWEDAQKTTTELLNLWDENEKENRLNSELIRRANRVMDKFDQYVLRGDGKQYGDDNDWVPWFNDNEQILERDPENVREATEDISLNEMKTAVNDLVTNARTDDLTFTLGGYTIWWHNFGGEKFWPYDSKAHKIADITLRLQLIESWVDSLSPGLARKTWELVNNGITWVAGTLWDVALWVGLLVGGVAVAYRFKEPLWNTAKSKFTKPAPGTPPAGWAGAGVTTAAKTPRKYTEVWNRLSIAPNSTNHDEYARKMAKEIENLHAHPAPWAVAIDLNEAKRREKVFWEIDAQYAKGKLSESQYLVKSEAAKKWHNTVAMYDDHSNLQYRASAKRLAVKLGEIPLGGTPFNLGTKSASESAIKKAQDRLKWTGTSGVDLSGAKVDFPDMQTKAYYEQFHDQLKKYEQMQEWWEHDAKIKLEEQKLQDLNAIDKANIVNEIALKDAAIAAEPHNIPGAPMAVPGAAPIPTQIPNPARQTLVNERSLLTQELSRINGEISQQSRAITTLRWQMTAWRPSSAAIPAGGTLRDVFVAEVRAQKLRIEQTIIDINAHIWGPAPAIRPWFFDPKLRKVDFNRLVTEFLGAVKK